jgi:hypothetical protein
LDRTAAGSCWTLDDKLRASQQRASCPHPRALRRHEPGPTERFTVKFWCQFRAPEAGNLRHGAIAELIEAAHKAGKKLSEREIRYRLEAARAYPYESQLRTAGAEFEHWRALRDAGFPASCEPGPDEEPFDPRTALEKARAGAKQLALGHPDPDGQLALFLTAELDTSAGLSRASVSPHMGRARRTSVRHIRHGACRI